MTPETAIQWTPEAINWLGAALYATRLSNTTQRLPMWSELPERLRREWENDAEAWLEALIPLLTVRHDA